MWVVFWVGWFLGLIKMTKVILEEGGGKNGNS